MKLPTRRRPSGRVQAIESISNIDSDRSERAHESRAEPRAPKQPCGIELARMTPDVTTFEECIEIQRLIHPQTEFRRADEEGGAERLPPGARPFRCQRVVPARRDRKLLVPPQRLAVLRSSEGE